MTGEPDKTAVRAEALRRRSAVPPETRAAFLERLARDGVELACRVPSCSVVSLFLPIRGEPDTLALIATLAGAGFVTALPVTPEPRRRLRFLAWRPGDGLSRGRYGLAEPTGPTPEVVPDLMFVPLAAFDARGYRIGYGGGYYDATLAALRSAGRVHAVGVAFSVQEVAAVPTEPHDQRIDAVMTERGLFTFGQG